MLGLTAFSFSGRVKVSVTIPSGLSVRVIAGTSCS
jgi:hypothetical protein